MKNLLIAIALILMINQSASFQTDINHCGDIDVLGLWTGLYLKFQPQYNNYCLFRLDGNGEPVNYEMQQKLYQYSLVYPYDYQNQYCDFELKSPVQYTCRFQNGYIDSNFELQGFGKSKLMMGQKMTQKEKTDFVFKAQVQVRPDDYWSEFGSRMNKALKSIKENGFGPSSCQNLSGNYIGQILETEAKTNMCNYSIISEIQATENKLSFHIKQEYKGTFYGQGTSHCFDVDYEIIVDCDSSQQTFIYDDTYKVFGGVFNDDMVIITNYKHEPQTIVLLRDE